MNQENKKKNKKSRITTVFEIRPVTHFHFKMYNRKLGSESIKNIKII